MLSSNKEIKRGAKKGENRFSKSQQKKVIFRLNRIKEVVTPKMRSICEKTHFKNVTAFRKMCAEVYNHDLPVSENKMTYRTFGASPYWEEAGYIYHAFYSDTSGNEISKMIMSLAQSDEVDNLKVELEKKHEEVAILSETLLNMGNINPLAIEDKKETTIDQNANEIDNLVAIINWFIDRTDDIITVDRGSRLIRDESDDLNGEMNKRISNTFFDYLDGKLHK
jgi:hypothetical protein